MSGGAPPGEVTVLLRRASGGDRDALDELMPLVYDELRRVARSHLRGERPGHTLHTTALVHEAYLRLVGQKEARYRDRSHFLSVASMCMRRILVNHARDRRRLKRGGDAVKLALDDATSLAVDERVDEILAVDDALTELAGIDARACRVVECRYFAGLSVDETAAALEVSDRTVRRDWLMAKAWLKRRMGAG